VSAGLPTTFESAIETVIAHSITCIDNKSATLTFVITTHSIERNPPAWGLFTLAGKVL